MAEATIDINIGDEEIKKLVHVALMEKLTPETREKLLADAVHVLISEKARYGDGETNLQAMFARAVNKYVSEYVDKMLAEDTEFTAQLEEISKEAFRQVFADPEQKQAIVEHVSQGIYKALGKGY